MSRILALLVLVAVSAITLPAAAQTTTVTMRADEGFRLHAAVGYPALAALGVGYKLKSGTEFLLQGGGTALWAFLAGTAEFAVNQDFVRRRWASFHAGLAASLLHSHAFVIDCYEGETCEDWIQDLYLASPRLGMRLVLDRNKRGGVLPYLDLSAGPQVGMCRGQCPNGDVVVNAAVHVRGVLDWARRE